ncbi:MAG: cupredoxin domain-containing protein [Pseudomonadota bacterium]|nr:cupredoxin domain-containing protein [Pseudomonadota bacterium]
MKRFVPGVAVLVLGVAGMAFAGAVQTVDQRNMKFSVATLTVNKGDVVDFMNSDDTSHNITISGDGFSVSSGLQKPGVDFKVPLVKPGIYHVTCGIHPKMKMTLIVE